MKCGAGQVGPIIVSALVCKLRSAKRNDDQEQQIFDGRRRGGRPSPSSPSNVLSALSYTAHVARGVESTAVDMFYTVRDLIMRN